MSRRICAFSDVPSHEAYVHRGPVRPRPRKCKIVATFTVSYSLSLLTSYNCHTVHPSIRAGCMSAVCCELIDVSQNLCFLGCIISQIQYGPAHPSMAQPGEPRPSTAQPGTAQPSTGQSSTAQRALPLPSTHPRTQ